MIIFRRVPVVRSPPCQVVKLGGVPHLENHKRSEK